MSPTQVRTPGSLPSVLAVPTRRSSSAIISGVTSTARMSCTPRACGGRGKGQEMQRLGLAEAVRTPASVLLLRP